MDREWMRKRLEEFREVCEEYAHSYPPSEYLGDPNIRARMFRLEPTAKAVLRALDPDLANFNLDTMAGEHEGIKAVDRGLGMLADLDDVASRLRPEAPTLPADQLHPLGLGCRWNLLGRRRARRRRRAGGQEHHRSHATEDRVPTGR
jgi:hypothetical protein